VAVRAILGAAGFRLAVAPKTKKNGNSTRAA